MPTWKMLIPPRRSSDRPQFLKGSTLSSVDLTKKCVCGCLLGNHYFTYVPGGHMCSTCESCDGFTAVGKQLVSA